jgi:RIO kinase 2
LKNAKYDGYRLTYGGLDYLSLNAYRKRNEVYSVGNQIGVGKESDIFVVADEVGTQRVLKIHRLGRISFRTVKANRDYLRNKSGGSWMYMSRLAALKEYTFMKALRESGFPVPEPIAQSRHTIVMSLIDAFPLRQISSVPDPASLYADLIDMILRLAQHGLIHGDFNEFNILIEEKKRLQTSPETSVESIALTPILIDFPQMVSMDHANAEMYFDRDVNCIKRFFERRFHFTSTEPGPFYADARKLIGKDSVQRLDISAEASGFSRKMAKELEAYMKSVGVDGDGGLGTKRGDENNSEAENDEHEVNESEEEDGEEFGEGSLT